MKVTPVRAFSYAYLTEQLAAALSAGYEFIACEDYVRLKAVNAIPPRAIVCRVDIDESCIKAGRLLGLFQSMNVRASFFVRLHASEYNPFSFANYEVLRAIRDAGYELGYHSEVVDQEQVWGEDAAECLQRDLHVLGAMLGVTVRGVASHGGLTTWNNLDFWKGRRPDEFGLLYEAYDRQPAFNLFWESFYLSDSEWTRWKCYDRGVLVQGDNRSLSEHVQDNHPLIYLLVHPDTYFERHPYE